MLRTTDLGSRIEFYKGEPAQPHCSAQACGTGGLTFPLEGRGGRYVIGESNDHPHCGPCAGKRATGKRYAKSHDLFHCQLTEL